VETEKNGKNKKKLRKSAKTQIITRVLRAGISSRAEPSRAKTRSITKYLLNKHTSKTLPQFGQLAKLQKLQLHSRIKAKLLHHHMVILLCNNLQFVIKALGNKLHS